MRRSERYWVVKHPSTETNYYYFHTIKQTREKSIQAFEEDDIGSWRRWYRRGFRCVKVRIVEV